MKISKLFLLIPCVITLSLHAIYEDQSQEPAVEEDIISKYTGYCIKIFRWRLEYKNSPSEHIEKLIPTNICLICKGNMRDPVAHTRNNHMLPHTNHELFLCKFDAYE
jgi:hypothetical protein